MSDTVVLAYSGGLDTSVILKWLAERGHDVVAYVANVGQQEDFDAVREKALASGAADVRFENLEEEFVTDYIYPAFKANAVYEGCYLMGTAIARPLIAKRQIEIARELGAPAVAHGATGKGNDQVRFELAYYALEPSIRVIAPWKEPAFLERFKGRPQLLAYAAEHGIPVSNVEGSPYSEDDNLLHISHESGVLEDPGHEPDESIWSKTRSPQRAPDTPARIELTFRDGIPVRLENLDDGTVHESPLELFRELNRLGGEHGVGRLDIVENRFVGVKSRGLYETPGGTILHVAHRDIEGIAMDREVRRLRDMLSAKLAEVIYNGFWFSPEMEFLMAAVDRSQEAIDGRVRLELYKGNVIVLGRESPSSLYDRELSSMDIEGGFDQTDSAGFIRINAIRLMAHRAIMERRREGGEPG